MHWRIQQVRGHAPQTSDEIFCLKTDFRANWPAAPIVIMQQGVQLQWGLAPWLLDQGLCPLTPLRALPPDSHCRFVLRIHHVLPSNLARWTWTCVYWLLLVTWWNWVNCLSLWNWSLSFILELSAVIGSRDSSVESTARHVGDVVVVDCTERAVCQGCIVKQYSHVPGVVHVDTDVWCVYHWPAKRRFYARFVHVLLRVESMSVEKAYHCVHIRSLICVNYNLLVECKWDVLNTYCDNTVETHDVNFLVLSLFSCWSGRNLGRIFFSPLQNALQNQCEQVCGV